MAHLAGLGLAARCRLLGRKFGRPVHMVVADPQTFLGCDLYQSLRDVRRDGLAALVVTNVSLCAPEGVCQGLLGQLEAFSDGSDRIHEQHSSGATFCCQYLR